MILLDKDDDIFIPVERYVHQQHTDTSSFGYRLVGLVVKASTSGAEDPRFESRFFPGRVIPVT